MIGKKSGLGVISSPRGRAVRNEERRDEIQGDGEKKPQITVPQIESSGFFT